MGLRYPFFSSSLFSRQVEICFHFGFLLSGSLTGFLDRGSFVFSAMFSFLRDDHNDKEEGGEIKSGDATGASY